MRRRYIYAGALGGALLLLAASTWGWWGATRIDKDTAFVVPAGASLTTVAGKLEQDGLVKSSETFLLWAKFLGSKDPVRAGEFLLPAGSSSAAILDTLQHGDVIRRFVTVPEGLPSILVWERLMAEPLLTGTIPVPAEGSVLPESYDFERGEARSAVLARMQQGMTRALRQAWAQRRIGGCPVNSPAEALTLASIVEKETGKPAERRTVAGVYCNRLRIGMKLDADPTVIYPITKGKPLGRRIRRSELNAITGYNTYREVGLPKGPITNPGKASLAAVLDPAATEALYFVADGTGGHVFAKTLAEQEANRRKWFAIRRARGEM